MLCEEGLLTPLQVLAIAMSIPSLVPRLLSLLPYCSPINDLFILLLRISSPPSHLLSCLVPQVIRMLDPVAPLGPEGHVAADELLRGVIELSSAAPIPLHPPPLNPANGQPPMEEDTWRENGLARQIADTKTVNTLLDWMLVGTDARDSALTPKPSSIDLPGLDSEPSQALRTSSLIQSISVLVDLIRKNNSDFVEQQMLGWARRKEAQESERELAGEQIEGVPSVAESVDRGPCILDLGEMLVLIAERLGGFQELVRHPRSLVRRSSPALPLLTGDPARTRRNKCWTARTTHARTVPHLRVLRRAAPLLEHEPAQPPRPRRPPVRRRGLPQGWMALCRRARGGIESGHHRRGRAGLPTSILAADALTLPPHGRLESCRSVHGLLRRVHPVGRGLARFRVRHPHSSRGQGAAGSASILSRGRPFRRPGGNDRAQRARGRGRRDRSRRESAVEPTGGQATTPGGLASTADGAGRGAATPVESQHVHCAARAGAAAQAHVHAVSRARDDAGTSHGPTTRQVLTQPQDLFFEFPWNNFLHNVVFDIVQQIFHGRIDRTLDRQLALSVFIDARLIDRILEGQATNDREW